MTAPFERRYRARWTLLFVPAALGVACNAIFGIEEPEHRPDSGGGSGATSGSSTVTGGASSGGLNGGTSGKGGTNGASSGASGDGGADGGTSAGGTTGGASKGGTSAGGTSAGGTRTGGNGGTDGGGASGAGGGGCPDNPADCEPSDPPSCSGLSKTACAGDSCCASPAVPGCTSCDFPSGHQSSVTAFRLDEFEVTVARFRNFVRSYSGPPAAGAGAATPGNGWTNTWDYLIAANGTELSQDILENRCDGAPAPQDGHMYTADPGANEEKPMNCITWYEAFAFCAYDGGFMPTEVQRTFAAAGGDENRYFPWGTDMLDAAHALWGHCDNGVLTECSIDNVTEVGSFPTGVGKYGQHDLTGSMWEWVFDYDGDAWPLGENCTDCVNTVRPSGGSRQIRGGGWAQGRVEQPVPYRNANDPPEARWWNLGVRCARRM